MLLTKAASISIRAAESLGEHFKNFLDLLDRLSEWKIIRRDCKGHHRYLRACVKCSEQLPTWQHWRRRRKKDSRAPIDQEVSSVVERLTIRLRRYEGQERKDHKTSLPLELCCQSQISSSEDNQTGPRTGRHLPCLARWTHERHLCQMR